ncbi:calpain-like protein, putative [Leishmania tarentolae]|uniref:Calpain-like protein, putative n=1 Tax=Leishmania tarentolae TaxID=5689 RepID=A0A640KNH5_LEITA|nr:calpain-like protein, putative [Leishmania tarentolae]
MPKIPLAVVSTSSDDSDMSYNDPVGVFTETNWAVLKIDSFESLPFSEVSHPPYGMDSNFLDSASPVGLTGCRPSPGGTSFLDGHNTVITPLKPAMLTPLPGISRTFRLHGSDQFSGATEGSGAMTAAFPAIPTKFTPKCSEALDLHPNLCGVAGVSGAASAVEVPCARKRKKKPPLHRNRSLRMEAAKWLEDDSNTEALVLREVFKRRPASPLAGAEVGDDVPLRSSETDGVLTPPMQAIAPLSSLTTELPTAVTNQTAPPTATLHVSEQVIDGSPTNPIRERVATAAVNVTKGCAPLMAPPVTTGDHSPVSQGSATAQSPLKRAARINMVPRCRPTPSDGNQGSGAAARMNSVAVATTRRHTGMPQLESPVATPQTGMPRLIRAEATPPAIKNAEAANTSDVTTPLPAENALAEVTPAFTEERLQEAKGRLPEFRQEPNHQESSELVEGPTADAHGSDDVDEKPASRPDSHRTAVCPNTVAVPSRNVEKSTSHLPQRSFPETSTKQRTHPRRTSFASTAIPESSSAASRSTRGTAEEDALQGSSRRPRRRRSIDSWEASTTRAANTESPSSLTPDSVVPEERPETRQYSLTESLGTSPETRMDTEKLMAFVRAVSDPEVLHVIYDYLEENQKSVPRYRLATKACRELLDRKEEMLMACLPNSGGGPHEPSQRCTFGHRRPRSMLVPQLVDTPDEKVEAARAGDGLTEAQRLLRQIEETEECDKDHSEDADMDEFDDLNYFPTSSTSFNRFSFGQPSVSGHVTRVFSEGMLYKIKSPKGEYYFYNDTLQEVMVVRVQCYLRGNEKISERAMLAPVAGTGETEITIAVLPEETSFFMSGVAHMPHFMAKRVQVPRDYVSPSVTQSLRKINAEINAVRKALGKWSRASDQQAYLKCCLKNNLRFTDLNFRPSSESLYRPEFDAVVIPATTWRRPEEYIYLTDISQTRLFRGEISCFLVKQGELNNHTVVAAIAAVAQFPDHVRWMFRHPVSALTGKMERAQGCYRVTLLHNGWWHTYLVDDYVPASLRGPLFACCAEDPRRLWVQLLEKAYAKSLGSYAATCLVDVMEALVDFTGFPVRFLDSVWAAAAQKPRGSAFQSLFRYLEDSLRAGYTVLLFSPSPTDEQSNATVDMSRKRLSRITPVKGAVPQFLPGHVYFLSDVAFYEELDLRMAQLKNPWTWETKNKTHYEKKWKYTTWYDQPESSLSAVVSLSSLNGQAPSGVHASHALSPRSCADMSPEAVALKERKGTMWVEWGEVLEAFAGGGVCYTMWNRYRYRVRNAFADGRPRLVLELKARRKVELIVTLSLETTSETLDNFGTVVAARPIPLHGTALSVVLRQANQSAKVLCESCEDMESEAGCRTYVVARDLSMRVVVEPSTSSNGASVLVVPLLDPSARSAATDIPATGLSSTAAATAAPPEVRFVMSIVSDAVAGDGEDLSVHFVSLRRSCGVFTEATTEFPLEGVSRVTAQYQVCTEKGVVACEGSRISGNDTKGI